MTTAAEADAAEQTHVVVLPVGSDRYALPITSIREVIARPTITTLVTAGSPVLGLLNLRGEIVPLFDTTGLLGLVAETSEPPEYAAVVVTAHGSAGLSASGLPYRAALPAAATASELPGTSGLHFVEGGPAALLDPEFLLAPHATDSLSDAPAAASH